MLEENGPQTEPEVASAADTVSNVLSLLQQIIMVSVTKYVDIYMVNSLVSNHCFPLHVGKATVNIKVLP